MNPLITLTVKSRRATSPVEFGLLVSYRHSIDAKLARAKLSKA